MSRLIWFDSAQFRFFRPFVNALVLSIGSDMSTRHSAHVLDLVLPGMGPQHMVVYDIHQLFIRGPSSLAIKSFNPATAKYNLDLLLSIQIHTELHLCPIACHYPYIVNTTLKFDLIIFVCHRLSYTFLRFFINNFSKIIIFWNYFFYSSLFLMSNNFLGATNYNFEPSKLLIWKLINYAYS